VSATPEGYQIQLPQFEGPFDLLLFFIERDELDIYDIPIYKITTDFLEYIHQMEKLNIELASDFILTASTLMHIKARMLLPRPERNEEGEIVDPRTELVERLLEYKRYKMVLDQIQNLELDRQDMMERGFTRDEQELFKQETSPEQELFGLDLFTILKTFKKVLERHHSELEKPKHVIQPLPYKMEEVKQEISQRIVSLGRIDFVTLILEHKDRMFTIFCFLSVLEMVQFKQLSIVIGEGYNNFWLMPYAESIEEESSEIEISEN
jgi:segregation and condensation protein A